MLKNDRFQPEALLLLLFFPEGFWGFGTVVALGCYLVFRLWPVKETPGLSGVTRNAFLVAACIFLLCHFLPRLTAWCLACWRLGKVAGGKCYRGDASN